MKLVCILLAITVAIVLISQIGSAVAKYSEYYEDPYYKADDIYDITQNVMEGVINSIIAYGLPLGVSIYIYVKGKDGKADPYKLFKIFVLTEVVLEIYQLIRSEVFSFSSPDIEDFMVFLFLLLPIAALPAGLYFLKIGKYKLFKVACVIFLVFPCIVWIQSNADFIEELTYIIEDLSGFEVRRYKQNVVENCSFSSPRNHRCRTCTFIIQGIQSGAKHRRTAQETERRTLRRDSRQGAV